MAKLQRSLVLCLTCFLISSVKGKPQPEPVSVSAAEKRELDLSALLSEKFVSCSNDCRLDPSCIGITIFQAHENSTVQTINDVFWCRFDLERREEDMMKGTVVYQAMLRDKLVKAQPTRRPSSRPKRSLLQSIVSNTKKLVTRQESASTTVAPLSNSPTSQIRTESAVSNFTSNSLDQSKLNLSVPPVDDNITVGNSITAPLTAVSVEGSGQGSASATVITPGDRQINAGNSLKKESTENLNQPHLASTIAPSIRGPPQKTILVPADLVVPASPQVVVQGTVPLVKPGSPQKIGQEIASVNPSEQPELPIPAPGPPQVVKQEKVPVLAPGPSQASVQVPSVTLSQVIVNAKPLLSVPPVESITPVPALPPAAQSPFATVPQQIPASATGKPAITSTEEINLVISGQPGITPRPVVPGVPESVSVPVALPPQNLNETRETVGSTTLPPQVTTSPGLETTPRPVLQQNLAINRPGGVASIQTTNRIDITTRKPAPTTAANFQVLLAPTPGPSAAAVPGGETESFGTESATTTEISFEPSAQELGLISSTTEGPVSASSSTTQGPLSTSSTTSFPQKVTARPAPEEISQEFIIPKNASVVQVSLPSVTLDLGRTTNAEVNVSTTASISTGNRTENATVTSSKVSASITPAEVKVHLNTTPTGAVQTLKPISAGAPLATTPTPSQNTTESPISTTELPLTTTEIPTGNSTEALLESTTELLPEEFETSTLGLAEEATTLLPPSNATEESLATVDIKISTGNVSKVRIEPIVRVEIHHEPTNLNQSDLNTETGDIQSRISKVQRLVNITFSSLTSLLSTISKTFTGAIRTELNETTAKVPILVPPKPSEELEGPNVTRFANTEVPLEGEMNSTELPQPVVTPSTLSSTTIGPSSESEMNVTSLESINALRINLKVPSTSSAPSAAAVETHLSILSQETRSTERPEEISSAASLTSPVLGNISSVLPVTSVQIGVRDENQLPSTAPIVSPVPLPEEGVASAQASDELCSFEDAERFKREIMATGYAVVKGIPTMITFVKDSNCVGTFGRNGRPALKSFSSIFHGTFFTHQRPIAASFYLNNSIYLFDADAEQTAVKFNPDPQSGTYVEESGGHLSTIEFLSEICGIHDPPPFVIKAAAQASQHDSSCVLFDKSGKLLISPDASEDARLLAKGILSLLDSEMFLYIESVFTWVDEPTPGKVYVFGSDREVYEILRDPNSDFKWAQGSYRSVPYDAFPYI